MNYYKNNKESSLSTIINSDNSDNHSKSYKPYSLIREEEQELIKKIQKCDNDKEYQNAAKGLMDYNIRFVMKVANKYKPHWLELTVLIDEGCRGLIEAAKRFDFKRGVKFLTYANWWIRAFIFDAIREEAGAVKLRCADVNLLYKVLKSRDKIRQRLGYEPSVDELAYELNISSEKIESVLMGSKNPISLNNKIKESERLTILDTLKSNNRPIDEVLDKLELVEKILGDLPIRERKVLEMRFGFYGREYKLEEIGEEFGVTRERIRQIENKAKERAQKIAKRKKLLIEY